MISDTENKIQRLQGPLLVLGASGFIGANLFRRLLQYRTDVYGTTSRLSPWRLEGLPQTNIIVTDLIVEYNLIKLLDMVEPRTVFDCVAYGAYSFQKETSLMYRTNVNFKVKLIEELLKRNVVRYIHAGSSSEYGDNASGPCESVALTPNSHYAVTKAAVSGLIYFAGKKQHFPCANLRFYSVYGPFEDASRLIPKIISAGIKGVYPPFVDPDISRDFVYVIDACDAFIDAALNLKEENYGESFNIGTGDRTTIADIARLTKEIFGIKAAPVFAMTNREWDVAEWYSNPDKARNDIGWSFHTTLREGLANTIEWYKSLENPEQYHKSSKNFGIDEVGGECTGRVYSEDI